MGFIISAIVAGLEWLANKAVDIAVTLYQVTILVGAAIARLGGFLSGIFKHTFDFFHEVWGSTLKPFISWSWGQIQKLHAWLKGVLTPALKFLDAVRTDLLNLWAKWLRPIFDTIDAVRSALRLLADFHVPFAAKLDDALAALEARLLAPIRFALTKINEVTNWIDRIIDFNGLFQRLTLVASAWTYERDMWRIWWASMHRREAERPKPTPGDVAVVDPASAAADVGKALHNQNNENGALVKEHAADVVLWLKTRPPVLT